MHLTQHTSRYTLATMAPAASIATKRTAAVRIAVANVAAVIVAVANISSAITYLPWLVVAMICRRSALIIVPFAPPLLPLQPLGLGRQSVGFLLVSASYCFHQSHPQRFASPFLFLAHSIFSSMLHTRPADRFSTHQGSRPSA